MQQERGLSWAVCSNVHAAQQSYLSRGGVGVCSSPTACSVEREVQRQGWELMRPWAAKQLAEQGPPAFTCEAGASKLVSCLLYAHSPDEDVRTTLDLMCLMWVTQPDD